MQFSCKDCLLAVLPAFLFSTSIYSHEVIQTKGLQDLEFKALVGACNTTNTICGLDALQYLTNPTNSIDAISGRQKLLQRFIEQEGEYQIIAETVAAITSTELHAAQYCDSFREQLNNDVQMRKKSQEIEKLFLNSEFFYRSSVLTYALPVFTRSMAQYNDSPLFLRCSYWMGMIDRIGPYTILPFILNKVSECFVGATNAGLEADRQGRGLSPAQPPESTSFARRLVQIFGISRTISKLNYVSAPETGTPDQRDNLVRDAVARQCLLNSENSSARDCWNARMTGWVRSNIDNDAENGNTYEQYIQDHPWAYYGRRIQYFFPTAFDSLSAVGTTGFMAYMVGSTAWRHIKNERDLWEHVKVLSQWGAQVRALAHRVRPYRKIWKSADCLMTGLEEPRMQDLFKSMQALENSWNKDHQWIHDPGRVLHIHYCAKKAAVQIQKVIRAVGEIDAWMSMVRTAKQYKLCPVQFVESPQAMVHASQLWSLLLDDAAAVKNDIILGNGPNKTLLTGPNGGGKSTVMKSLGQAILLAQSWGFAPADEFFCTPFDCVIVAMDSHQSLKANLSTFMAELKTLKWLKQTAQLYAEQGKRCLIILDEPCRGSIEIESAKRISQFCSDLDVYENVAAMLATHMYEPARLADSLNSWCNYQLGYTFLRNGVVRTFKLSPGIAHWWFNDADKRELFLQSLEHVIEQTG